MNNQTATKLKADQSRPQSDQLKPQADLAARYLSVRAATEKLCETLSAEDCAARSMTNCSPAKWHLAHTAWFFETFLLEPHLPGYQHFDPSFRVLFNSYYQTVGEQFARPQRGLITRPGLQEVFNYRRHVDQHMAELFEHEHAALAGVIETGLNHEQQHQELLLTDIKHLFSFNPLHPIYRESQTAQQTATPEPIRWHRFNEGLARIGFDGSGFSFDNERPRHRVFLGSYELASRLTTNGEFLDFIGDGGYERPELWLSDGWETVQQEKWRAPLYWFKQDGEWQNFTLSGLRPVSLSEPVCHVSFYEADAYARWAGARVPTEAEWESAAANLPIIGNFVEGGLFHPAPVHAVLAHPALAAENAETIQQMFGDVWEWTGSAYLPWPGYQPESGALGEYNGKFMCNQMVLRGGSCATPQSHIRPTYRNFFTPESRWQFSGVRLAR